MANKLIVLFLLLGAQAAAAHVNERGLDYEAYKDHRGVSCCGNTDCRPAADYVDTVENGFPVVRLLIDGRWISVPRYFVVAEDATDGRAHWCGRILFGNSPGENKPLTLCIILPPRAT